MRPTDKIMEKKTADVWTCQKQLAMFHGTQWIDKVRMTAIKQRYYLTYCKEKDRQHAQNIRIKF